MTEAGPLKLGTRGSDLALWQARRVSKMIKNRLGRESTIEIIKTSGDRIQNVSFHKMEGKGFFTKELQDALLERRVDLVVHSLKDLPTDEPDGLLVVAVPERETSADLLLARPGVLGASDPLGLTSGAVLGTSSLRRAAQVLAACPGVKVAALRGNVPTRVQKLRDGHYDAIVLAAAGVGRLELDLGDLDKLVLSPEAMLPAPGQGALAIETRAGDPQTEALAQLNDAAVARCVEAERWLLQLIGGGCHVPLGSLASSEGKKLRLQAILGEVDETLSCARVARAEALADSPQAVAQACFEELKEKLPTAVS